MPFHRHEVKFLILLSLIFLPPKAFHTIDKINNDVIYALTEITDRRTSDIVPYLPASTLSLKNRA